MQVSNAVFGSTTFATLPGPPRGLKLGEPFQKVVQGTDADAPHDSDIEEQDHSCWACHGWTLPPRDVQEELGSALFASGQPYGSAAPVEKWDIGARRHSRTGDAQPSLTENHPSRMTPMHSLNMGLKPCGKPPRQQTSRRRRCRRVIPFRNPRANHQSCGTAGTSCHAKLDRPIVAISYLSDCSSCAPARG